MPADNETPQPAPAIGDHVFMAVNDSVVECRVESLTKTGAKAKVKMVRRLGWAFVGSGLVAIRNLHADFEPARAQAEEFSRGKLDAAQRRLDQARAALELVRSMKPDDLKGTR